MAIWYSQVRSELRCSKLNAVSPEALGKAAGVMNTMQQFGAVFGIAMNLLDDLEYRTSRTQSGPGSWTEPTAAGHPPRTA